MLINIR